MRDRFGVGVRLRPDRKRWLDWSGRALGHRRLEAVGQGACG